MNLFLILLFFFFNFQQNNLSFKILSSFSLVIFNNKDQNKNEKKNKNITDSSSNLGCKRN